MKITTIKWLLFIVILSTKTLIAQELPPKEPSPIDVKQIHSGHSLTDPLFHPWPGQYRYLIYDILNGNYDNLGKATVPGSPMFWRWDNEHTLDPSARFDIQNWELLIITEGIPIPDDGNTPPQITPAKEYLSNYVNNAWINGNNGNGAATLLWTTWTNIDDSDGPWRQMIDEYEVLWEEMMDYANDNRPDGATPVYIIPGHRMMAQLYDDIQSGLVPGITSIDDFFSDTIHLNDLGAYAMAMIHYACIYNESPVGITNNLFAQNDQENKDIPSMELANYLQTMIWQVVINYSRTGITDETLSINDNAKPNTIDCVFPNPAKDKLTICNNDKDNTDKVIIFDLTGKIMLSTYQTEIDIRDLSSGYYFISKGGKFSKFIKL